MPKVLAAAFVVLVMLAVSAAVAGVYVLTAVPAVTCVGHKGC